MRPVEEIEADLVRVTGERDALARHIEALSGPVTDFEATTFLMDLTDAPVGSTDTVRNMLNAFIDARKRRGQFAALS